MGSEEGTLLSAATGASLGTALLLWLGELDGLLDVGLLLVGSGDIVDNASMDGALLGTCERELVGKEEGTLLSAATGALLGNTLPLWLGELDGLLVVGRRLVAAAVDTIDVDAMVDVVLVWALEVAATVAVPGSPPPTSLFEIHIRSGTSPSSSTAGGALSHVTRHMTREFSYPQQFRWQYSSQEKNPPSPS